MNVYTQKRTCSDNMVFGSVLVKIFQCCNAFGNGLYLIEYNQRVVGVDFKIAIRIQYGNNPVRIKVYFKQVFRSIGMFKIDVSQLFVSRFSKFLQKIGLSYLPCPQKNKWFPFLRQLPLIQSINLIPIHFSPSFTSQNYTFLPYNQEKTTLFSHFLNRKLHFSPIWGTKCDIR